MKKFLRIFLVSVCAAAAFLLILLGVTQTQFFRDRLRAVALDQMRSLFAAETRMGQVRGNIVSGFSIDSVAFVIDGLPALSADRIDLRYNLFDVSGRIISVSNLTLVRPQFRLLRGMDSVWNISRLLRPTPDDTLPKKPFDWPVAVNRLEIQDGLFVVADSLVMRERPPRDTLSEHLHDFTVSGINLLLSARISPKEKHIAIARLSAFCPSPGITLHLLSGDFTVTPEEARVQGLQIVTGRSSVNLTASMRRFNLLGGIDLADLERCPVDLRLEGKPVDLNELQQFLPALDFLNGRVSIALSASGEFGRLTINPLDLETEQTRMRWKGLISNLHRPRDLTLSVKMHDGVIHPGDLLTLMPPFHLPDYTFLGATSLTLEFDGRPLDFRTKVTLGSSAGTVSSDVSLKIGGPAALRYRGSITMSGVNPARITGNERLEGSLNGGATFDGEGVSLDDLASSFDITLDRSEFRGLSMPPSHISIDARDHVLNTRGNLGLGEMTSTFSAQLDRRDRARPHFSVDADVAALNLAHVLHDNEYDSDLTMHLHLRGQGLSWSSLGGEAVLDLSSSRYREYRVASGDIRLLLDQSDPRAKELRLMSNIADFSLTGAFNLRYLTRLIGFEAENLRFAVGQKLASLDTSLVASIDRTALDALGRSLEAASDSLNAEYALEIKDLEPVSVVAGNRLFQGKGTLTGSVQGSYRDLSLHNLLDAQFFFYGTVERGLLLQNARVGFDLAHLEPSAPLHNASIRLSVEADKVHINRTALDSLAIDFRYADEFAEYAVRTVANAVDRASLRGTARITDAGIAAGINGLQLAYRDFAWTADSGASLTVSATDAAIRNLALHRDSSSITLDAHLGPGGALDGSVSGRSLSLDDLRYVLKAGKTGTQGDTFVGSADATVNVRGSLRNPVMHALVRARDISFRRVLFGNLDADISYADSSVRVDLHGGAAGDTASAALTIAGTLPLNLAFTGAGDRIGQRPMSLSIVSTGTQMSILDPLLPTFNDLSGIMRCRLTVAGTPLHPQYAGSMSLENCTFLFVPNNIQYTLNASFQPDGERIRVIDAAIRNIPADEQGGRTGEIHMNGDFAFRDFIPGDFNLSASGTLLVVKETSRLSSLSLYGNLFTEIGEGGLRFTGNVDSSMLRGSVIVSNSNLVFPPITAAVEEESPLSIPLVFVNDTSSARRAAGRRTELASYFGADSVSDLGPGDAGDVPSRSFLDGMKYDLDIETAGGNTQIRMIFNAITNEELVAFIDGTFNVTGDGRQWFGDLTVNRAYYNFFKRFNATGTIHYRGNVLNPELDIQATYAGQRSDTAAAGGKDYIVVTFKITGTRLEPKADVSMTINGEDYYQYTGPSSRDVQSDAIQFIVYGSFPLTAPQRAEAGTNIGSTLSSSLLTGASSLLTGSLSEFLRRQTGFINSVEFSYNGGLRNTVGESADIRLTGVAWSGIWRYGGKILDKPLSNANFSIQYSFGTIFEKPSLRNLMIELERKVETNTLSTTDDLKQTNSLRLFYRFSF